LPGLNGGGAAATVRQATKENNTKNKENTKYTCMDTHKKIDKYNIQV